MKRIHYLIIGTLIVVVAILLARFLISEKKQPKRNATKKTEIFVKVQKVEYKENDISLNYRGRVESFNNIALSSEVSGKILKGDINLKAGTNFKKGDILFKIYSQDIEAQLIAQKSTFLQTLSNVLPDIKVDFPDQYSKWINFFNDFDINKKLPKLPQYSSNKEKVFLASQGLLTSYYNLAQKEITLGKYIVKAPFDGSLTSVSKQIGDVTNSGGEIATIIRKSKLEVTVPIFPKDLKWIKKGNKAILKTSRENEITGTVERIASFVEESTQSVNVYLNVLQEKETFLLQGEYVNATFNIKNILGMRVPREAIVDNDFIYILENNTLVKSKIKIVEQTDDSCVISGLKENTQAVIESIASVEKNIKYLPRK